MRHVELQKLHEAQRSLSRSIASNPRVVLRCGRRFGKTTLLEREVAKRAFLGQRVGWFSPTYKLNAPSYSRILRTLLPVVSTRSKVEQLIETRSGGGVEFWTLQDVDAGRSRAYDFVVIDEASLVAKGLRDIWEQAISPTLLDRQGSAVIAGTPKGTDPDNFFYAACTNPELGWIEHHAPTRENPMLNPEAVARLVTEYPPLVYQQEFLAEFVDWSGTAFFSQDQFLIDGQPLPMPRHCDFVFAVIDTAVKTGSKNDGTAVVFYAQDNIGSIPLYVLDWDIVQLEGSLLEAWLPSVFQRLEQLAPQCGARHGSVGAFIEDKASGMILIQQAQRRGWPVTAIDGKITALGKDERSLNVCGYHYQGKCKIVRDAFEKVASYKEQSRNHFLAQVCGFRIGVKDQADDLLDCYTYGLAAALGNQEYH